MFQLFQVDPSPHFYKLKIALLKYDSSYFLQQINSLAIFSNIFDQQCRSVRQFLLKSKSSHLQQRFLYPLVLKLEECCLIAFISCVARENDVSPENREKPTDRAKNRRFTSLLIFIIIHCSCFMRCDWSIACR